MVQFHSTESDSFSGSNFGHDCYTVEPIVVPYVERNYSTYPFLSGMNAQMHCNRAGMVKNGMLYDVLVIGTAIFNVLFLLYIRMQ